jgi:DNA-directed RNA polymerase subunit F
MSRRVVGRKDITISEAKELLERIKEPNQFQLRTMNYANKFSKMKTSTAIELVNLLIDKFNIDRKDAVQVVNCMPASIYELRAFFSTGRKRIILTAQLKEMLGILNEYRKKQG